MKIILDVFWIKNFEKKSGYTFTQQELDLARESEGVAVINYSNKAYEVRIPYLKFPYELMAEEIQSSELYPETKLPWDN